MSELGFAIAHICCSSCVTFQVQLSAACPGSECRPHGLSQTKLSSLLLRPRNLISPDHSATSDLGKPCIVRPEHAECNKEPPTQQSASPWRNPGCVSSCRRAINFPQPLSACRMSPADRQTGSSSPSLAPLVSPGMTCLGPESDVSRRTQRRPIPSH